VKKAILFINPPSLSYVNYNTLLCVSHKYYFYSKKGGILKISEIFLSIQGEGTRAGELCVFLRTFGCSFDCFYCDTKYANSEIAKEYTVDEIVESAKKFGVNLVEITGGEPLEQEETRFLAEKLLENGFEVLIETNGAQNISVLPEEVIKIMDIKLPWVSLNGEKKHFYYENLKYLSENDEVKFVIDGETGYNWAKNFIETHKIPCKIIFSPCAEKMSATELAEKIIADKLPVRLGLQIHKVLWGDKTGV
jgi:7-carboxy-7-deazaguanine synthase